MGEEPPHPFGEATPPEEVFDVRHPPRRHEGQLDGALAREQAGLDGSAHAFGEYLGGVSGAGAGHRDQFLARAAGEIAIAVLAAAFLAQRVQAARAGGAGRT